MTFFLPPLCFTKAYLVMHFGAEVKHVSKPFSIISFSLPNKSIGPWRNTRESRSEGPFRKEGSIFHLPQFPSFHLKLKFTLQNSTEPKLSLFHVMLQAKFLLVSHSNWNCHHSAVNNIQGLRKFKFVSRCGFATQNSFCFKLWLKENKNIMGKL